MFLMFELFMINYMFLSEKWNKADSVASSITNPFQDKLFWKMKTAQTLLMGKYWKEDES